MVNHIYKWEKQFKEKVFSFYKNAKTLLYNWSNKCWDYLLCKPSSVTNQPLVESIKINEDLYLAPVSKNNKGCTEFRMISKSGKPTKQVIFTVNKKGEYSPGQIKNCI